MNRIRLTALAGFALAAIGFAVAPASALTTKECGVKYQAAKEAGTLAGMGWNEFRKAKCGPEATMDDAAKGLTSKQCGAKYQAAKEAGTLGDMKWNDFRKAECGPGASADTGATKASKATASDDNAAKGLTSKQCGAKYQAAKEAGTLGDMKWNDFRKAECGPGASADIGTTKSKAKKAAASAGDTAKGLTSRQCSAKYQAAKAADALNGMKWNDYRKAECGPGASAAFAAPKVTKASTSSGGGLSMKACSARYQSAKDSGALGGLKWNDFRKARCGAAAADDETVPAESEADYTNEPEKPTIAAPGGVKFPRAVSSKYASEPAGKARMHTCLQQYYADKDNNALGGLKWIQKGGGYYSLCNARLKGGAS